MGPSEPSVLIVDDDPSICAALSRLFKSVGLAAQSFGRAREFLDQAPNLRAGCLILDLRLPDLSGIEVQAELTRSGIGIPVIFLTAHGSSYMRAKALQAGALGFLEKPVQDQALLTLVFKAIERDRQAPLDAGFGPTD